MKLWPAKDPDEQLKFSYDFAPDLAPAVTLEPLGTTFTPIDPDIGGNAAGTTIVGEDTTGTVFTVEISGGNDGEEARWTLRVTATDGQVFEDTVALPIVSTSTLLPVAHAGDYTPPTPGNLLAVFAEFSSVPPATIAYYLNRAARSVDTSWSEGDFAHARILLAAHLMTLGGLGTSAEAASVNDGSGQFRSMAIGSLRLERFDPGREISTFASTRYGREFAKLLRMNRGGPIVAGAVPGGWGDGDKAWY